MKQTRNDQLTSGNCWPDVVDKLNCRWNCPASDSLVYDDVIVAFCRRGLLLRLSTPLYFLSANSRRLISCFPHHQRSTIMWRLLANAQELISYTLQASHASSSSSQSRDLVVTLQCVMRTYSASTRRLDHSSRLLTNFVSKYDITDSSLLTPCYGIIRACMKKCLKTPRFVENRNEWSRCQ